MEYILGKRPRAGRTADRSRTLVSMPKPDKRTGTRFLRVLFADGVLGDQPPATASLVVDGETRTARIVAGGVKVRTQKNGRTYADFAVPDGLSMALAGPGRDEADRAWRRWPAGVRAACVDDDQ